MDFTVLRQAIEQANRLRPELAWLQEVRGRALERLVKEGLPTIADEDWRYTDLSRVTALTASPSLLPPPLPLSQKGDPIRELIVPGLDGNTAVFVDGAYRVDLSRVSDASGVAVMPIGQAPSSMRGSLAQRIGGATVSSGGLAALNTALFRDGLMIEVAAGVTLDEPLYVVMGSTADDPSYNRLLVQLGAGSRATIIEHHASVGSSVSNSMTEIACGGDSHLTYAKLQAESASATHLASQHVAMERGARAELLHIDLGAKLARNDLHIELSGDGAEASAHGLFFADGSRHLDNHTRIDHRGSRTRSRELYRGIADGQGRGIFNGKVIVHAGAIKSDAHLSNQNLLLSRTAEIDTKPELEIYTDDVKCSHGATTGQLDANSIFYLRSRGIPEIEARRMLIAAFAREIIKRLPGASLDAHVVSLLRERLPDMRPMAGSP